MQTQKNVKVKIAKHKPNERPKKYQSKKWFGIELYKEQKATTEDKRVYICKLKVYRVYQ